MAVVHDRVCHAPPVRRHWSWYAPTPAVSNHGMSVARGDYLVFTDDDDIFAPGALAAVRRGIASRPDPCVHMFRFAAARFWWSRIPAAPGLLACGAIGGHCIVPPNDPAKLGRWSDRYVGDWDFIEETVALWGGPASLVWHPEVITYAR